MNELTFHFSESHPCGAGHFPGNPIIPGALLLDETLARIAASLGMHHVIWHIKSAKFPMSTRPGDIVHANFSPSPNGEIRFDCFVSGNKVLSGTARGSALATTGSTP